MKINGERHYLRRAVDHGGDVLESFVIERRDRKGALKFLGKTTRLYGFPKTLVTDKLRSCGAAMKVIGNAGPKKRVTGKMTVQRIHTVHCDDGNMRSSVYGRCDVCRNAPPFILRSATASTRKATSTLVAISSGTATLLSPGGASWAWHKEQSRFPGSDWIELV